MGEDTSSGRSDYPSTSFESSETQFSSSLTCKHRQGEVHRQYDSKDSLRAYITVSECSDFRPGLRLLSIISWSLRILRAVS